MDGRIETALAVGFPDRDVASLHEAGISWNDLNETVRVEFTDGESVFLKVATDGDPTRAARERSVVEYVRATCDVPVPAVVASDTDSEVPFVATEPVAGEGFLSLWRDGDATRRRTLARQYGASLAHIHAARFDVHGHIVGGGADGLDLETKPWTDVLVDTIEQMRTIAPAERFADHFDRVVDAVEANRAVLDDAPAALLHGDPAQPNQFRVDDRVGFIDWELAHVGDPVRELRRSHRQLDDCVYGDRPPERWKAAFHEGYRSVAGSLPMGYAERLLVYDAVVFLGTSTFFERWSPRADEPTERLAGWVEAEMAARLGRLA